MAALLNMPVPQHPFCLGTRHDVMLSWKQTANANVKKFNIYRSLLPDSAFVPAGQALAPAFSWSDTNVQAGIKYYYRVTSEDFSGNESTVSNTVSGAASPKNRPLHVVKDTKGGFNNPADSAVMVNYHRMFRDLPCDFSDASVSDSLDISILGKYQRIFWLSNSFSDQPNSSFKRHRDEVLSYLRGGGQLFVAGFQPTFLVAGNNKFVKSFIPTDTIYQFYKISQVERKPQALLNGALPVKSEYPLLAVDTSRCLKQLPGHLMNLESISPTPDASLIYRWRTAYDSATNQGSMKNRPVGIEYLGDDYKLILLSVPLFYLDSIEAKYLVELVVNDKFRSTVDVREQEAGGDGITGIYPNPARGTATIGYQIAKRSLVSAEVYDLNGYRVFSRPVQTEEAGSHVISFDVSRFSPGLYLVNIKTGKRIFSGKLMVD
jgi:hypothetical protein